MRDESQPPVDHAPRLGIKEVRSWLASRNLSLLPFFHVMRGYQRCNLRGDMRAGVNIALLAFPQGMAYALIAGLPISYGVFGSAVATVFGALFTRSRQLILGPTNATAVMLLSVFATIGVAESEKVQLLPVFLAMVGLFLIIGACMHVANLVQYISRTVITGYITAAAALIIANQIRPALGFEFGSGEQATTFVGVAQLTALHLGEASFPALVASLVTVVIYICLHRFAKGLPNVALTLLAVSILGVAAEYFFSPELDYLQPIRGGELQLTIPAFDPETISMLANGALAIALLCMIEACAIGKSLAARSGERFDANQEMLNLGTANMSCGLFSGMPASGSLTRSVLAWNSGVATPLGGLISGLLVAAGALTVGSLTGYIPKASLAVLVIIIGISLINLRQIRVVTRSTGSDAAVFLITFTSGLLFPLDTAIYLGVGTSIVLFLRKAAAPEMVEYAFNDDGQLAELGDPRQRRNPEISIVHVEGNLFFGAAELFRDQIRRVCEDPLLKIVILKMRNAHHLDATSVMALEELIRYMNEHNRTLLISEARKDVIRIFQNSGLLELINRRNIFPDITPNPTLSTARALKRAKEILGDETADVKIYVSDKKAGTP